MARKTLTPDERERIVELKLNRIPVRQIAEQVDVSTTTVQQVWKKYLTDREAEATKSSAVVHQEALARLDQNATDARRGFLRAMRGNDPDLTAARGYLEAERNALKEHARLAGLYVLKVEHTGADGGPIEVTADPKDMLRARLAAMAANGPEEVPALDRVARPKGKPAGVPRRAGQP